MECEFKWNVDVPENEKIMAEDEIKKFLVSGHSQISPCHPGKITVKLAVAGLFMNDLAGGIWCNCGSPIGTIKGKKDGSTLSIYNVSP